MDVRGVRVLLVWNAARKASILEDYLLKQRCDICFATSQKDALELLQRHRFDLILSEFMLSDGTAYQLMEDHGMRPAQFRLLLDEILFDKLLRNANERRCERRENRSDGLDVPIRKE